MAKKQVEQNEMTIHYIAIDELIPADYNPRRMNTEDRKHIKASLSKYGFVDPVVVNQHPDRFNVIVGGHQRTIIAKEELGMTTVPCIFVNLDLENERELNVRLNKNTGRFDEEKLSVHFTKDFLKEIGFKDDELGFFITEFEKKFESINDKNCDMPIVPRFSEKYDSVIIVSDNTIDTAFLETTLNIGNAQSYKNQRTGKAMIISVEQFKQAIYGSKD